MSDRVLTEKEKIRTEKIEKLKKDLKKQGYQSKDLTMSILKGNLMAFVIGTPVVVLFGILFFKLYPQAFLSFGLFKAIIFFILFCVATVIHECIHGLTWAMYAKNAFHNIEYGFVAGAMTPYCTCLDPLTKQQYIRGSIMPGLILGLIPLVASILTGYFMVFLFGVAMFYGAGGDFAICLKILGYRSKSKDVIFVDHPTELGLIVFEKA